MILEAKGLGKTFGDFTALRDVSLHLERGEVVGFLGPNGAGKSTTMHLLTGYLAPTTGSATINGHDLAGEPLACRRQIGYLPQEPPLYPDMKVEAYLDHVARLKGIARDRRRAEVGRVIEFADLGEARRRHIHKLSGGNRQRVGLAQALIGTPPILILDEATAGLDPAQVANLRELLGRLADAHGVLLSTHIMGEVEACCSRVIVIHRGHLLLSTTVADLRRRCGTTTRLALRLLEDRQAECCERLRACAWADEVTCDDDAIRLTAPAERRRELVELAQACGGLRELVEERRSLEELFRELIS